MNGGYRSKERCDPKMLEKNHNREALAGNINLDKL